MDVLTIFTTTSINSFSNLHVISSILNLTQCLSIDSQVKQLRGGKLTSLGTSDK